MVSVYDCSEPTIINEELLQKAVDDQRPKGEAGRIALQDGIKFSDVKVLILSFRTILQIENLWSFTTLERLNLDNNLIEKIEGLETLVNLKWLDLSFNKIEVIAGLNTLKKLEDLSLYNNHIKRLQGIENLQNLQVFSIGNNNLEDIDDLLILRKLKSLKTVNFAGNPFCKDPFYKTYIAAILPQINYLNYRLIDDETKTIGYDKYFTQTGSLNAKDKAEQTLLAEKEIDDSTRKLYQAAGIASLQSTVFFDGLFANVPKLSLCLSLEGGDRIFQHFKELFVDLCKNLFDFGLEEYHKRKEEVDMFTHAIETATRANQQRAVFLIDEFLAYKEKSMNIIKLCIDENGQQTDEDCQDALTLITSHHQEIALLWDRLMENELHLSDQIVDSVREFERVLMDLTVNACEVILNTATHMRDLENQFNEQLIDLCSAFMDKVIKEEEIVMDHMKDLFLDKDTVISTVNNAHDARILKIDRLEDKTGLGIKGWTNTCLENMRQDEIRRHRNRILEITHFIDCQRADADEVERTVKELMD